ncbi:MAG: hypothetical protein AAF830_06950 [Pseudomonadota bacterium]
MTYNVDPDSAGMRALNDRQNQRAALLQRIGEARGSTVLTYMTSYREGWGSAVMSEDVRVIERHVAQMRAAGVQKLDLFLSTWGGDATLPWSLHAMLRDYLPKTKIGVILPFESYSAGTGIALGADEIVMGLSSVLGPTDTQAFGYFWGQRPSGGGVSSLQGFMQLLKDFDMRGKIDDATMLDWLTRNSDPMKLGAIYRIFRENKRKILKILNSRLKPLSAKDNDRLADFFLYDIGIHGQGIRRREAQDAGLSYVTDLEATGLEAEVASLFEAYADAMQLFVPFARAYPPAAPGFSQDVNLDGEHAGDTPVVLIESVYGTDAGFSAFGVDRAWGDKVRNDDEPENEAPDDYGHGHLDRRAMAPMRLSWGSSPGRQEAPRGQRPGGKPTRRLARRKRPE